MSLTRFLVTNFYSTKNRKQNSVSKICILQGEVKCVNTVKCPPVACVNPKTDPRMCCPVCEGMFYSNDRFHFVPFSHYYK